MILVLFFFFFGCFFFFFIILKRYGRDRDVRLILRGLGGTNRMEDELGHWLDRLEAKVR